MCEMLVRGGGARCAHAALTLQHVPCRFNMLRFNFTLLQRAVGHTSPAPLVIYFSSSELPDLIFPLPIFAPLLPCNFAAAHLRIRQHMPQRHNHAAACCCSHYSPTLLLSCLRPLRAPFPDPLLLYPLCPPPHPPPHARLAHHRRRQRPGQRPRRSHAQAHAPSFT